jgi:hypothetical protein
LPFPRTGSSSAHRKRGSSRGHAGGRKWGSSDTLVFRLQEHKRQG